MWRRVYKAGGGKKIEDGGEVAEEEEERKLTKFMALHPPLKSWGRSRMLIEPLSSLVRDLSRIMKIYVTRVVRSVSSSQSNRSLEKSKYLQKVPKGT